uniref:Putative secreted protein n=1 Tax=Anopheles triannulatus TaxID=58253 RepID=A0A2M4B525_9DIPT
MAICSSSSWFPLFLTIPTITMSHCTRSVRTNGSAGRVATVHPRGLPVCSLERTSPRLRTSINIAAWPDTSSRCHSRTTMSSIRSIATIVRRVVMRRRKMNETGTAPTVAWTSGTRSYPIRLPRTARCTC